MTAYRRTKIATVNCAERHNSRLFVNHLDALRQSFQKVKNAHPFAIDAMVVLPEHLHCIWTLLTSDVDYKT